MDGEFIHPQRVYIEDTDAGGIVYYVNYLKFMERTRTEFLRKLGFAKPAMITEGILLVVASSMVNYLKPARLDDQLDVTARILKLARTYILFEQCIYRGGEKICDGEVKVACVTKDTMKPVRMPKDVERELTRYQIV